MNWAAWINGLQWFFLLYFIAVNVGYILLNLLSIRSLRNYMEAQGLADLPAYSGYEPPISILIPAYNEESTMVNLVRSLLQLDYPEFEIIVVNDGSKDNTLAVLQQEFSLVLFPEAYWQRIRGKGVRAIYRSSAHSNLRVIEKEHGGKADALNAGINASRYPLFCAVSADSILQRDSLRRAVQPFLENPLTVASGGAVRVANDCELQNGFLTGVVLPKSGLAMMQVVESLRTFLFGAMGWSELNAMLIVSGAFGLFRKDTVIEAGGYLTSTSGEDMELIVRLHHMLRLKGIPYRITFVPDPIFWTRAPESSRALKAKRANWQRRLAESLNLNMPLLFNRKGGAVSWLAFPFVMIFEWLGPMFEVMGYIFMISGFALKLVSWQVFTVFLLVAIGFGMMLSVTALLLEELSFHIYPRTTQLAKLLIAVLVENFGYRQQVSLWRFMGLLRWIFHR
ncbi:MAG TPA: glycosyltransferase [Burkholderiales bacterium]|nr:glycosyltransferase [Burkholderiales bacterium]